MPRTTMVASPRAARRASCQAQARPATDAANHDVMMNAEAALASHQMTQFYNGVDCSALRPFDMQRVRELQTANDNLQRQLSQIATDISNSEDAL